MNLLLNVILFVFVLLFYLNFLEEIKIGQDLDILEIDYQNAEELNRVCQNKQPVVFRMDQGYVIPDSHYINGISPTNLSEKYGNEDVFLSTYPYNKFGEPNEEPTVVPLKDAVCVQHDHIFENNHDFVMDLPIRHYYQSIDPFLRPFGTVQTEYDFAFGNNTALRYHQHHSFFVYAVGGDLEVKLTPHKNIVAGFENPFDNYVYPDFHQNKLTLLNCWTDYLEEDEDSHFTFLKISVPQGNCLFIPPYWWFSIRSVETGTGGWMAIFKYDTIMGKFVYWLDKIKKRFTRTHTDVIPKKSDKQEEETPLLDMDE